MPFHFGEAAAALLGVLVTARTLSTAGVAALFAVARHLLAATRAGAATDIGRIGEALIGNVEAQTEERRAKAAKTRAEAATLNATAVKTLSEAAAIENQRSARAVLHPPSTPEARMTAWREAEERYKDAAAQLRRLGGDVGVDVEELLRLLPPPPDDPAM